jgi:hypothetical protein
MRQGLTKCIMMWLFATNVLLAQEISNTAAPLHRLSVSVSTSYFINPWTKYNQTLEDADRQVRFYPVHNNPSG